MIRDVASYSSPLYMMGNYKTYDNHLSFPVHNKLEVFQNTIVHMHSVALQHDHTSGLLISLWWQFIRPLFPPLKEQVSCTELIHGAFISACLNKVTFLHMYDCGMMVDCDINVGYESGHERAGAAGAQSRLKCMREGYRFWARWAVWAHEEGRGGKRQVGGKSVQKEMRWK